MRDARVTLAPSALQRFDEVLRHLSRGRWMTGEHGLPVWHRAEATPSPSAAGAPPREFATARGEQALAPRFARKTALHVILVPL